MAESKRLAAHRATAPALRAEEVDPVNPEITEESDETCNSGKKKKDKNMADATANDQAIETARTEARAAERSRFSTVLASEHYAGREALASNLLAKDALTAEDIVAALEAAPKTAATPAATEPDAAAAKAAAAKAAAEAAARAEMQAAINEGSNSEIDADAGGKPSTAANATAVWDRVIARMPGNSAK